MVIAFATSMGHDGARKWPNDRRRSMLVHEAGHTIMALVSLVVVAVAAPKSMPLPPVIAPLPKCSAFCTAPPKFEPGTCPPCARTAQDVFPAQPSGNNTYPGHRHAAVYGRSPLCRIKLQLSNSFRKQTYMFVFNVLPRLIDCLCHSQENHFKRETSRLSAN